MLAVIAFLCGLGIDIVWTLCIRAIQGRRALMAANMSVLIFIFATASTVAIIERNIPAIIAYAAGGWIGTYLITKRK